MNQTFIFDMDGVIVDSEQGWGLYGKGLSEKFFGKEIAEKLNDNQFVGLSLPGGI